MTKGEEEEEEEKEEESLNRSKKASTLGVILKESHALPSRVVNSEQDESIDGT